MRQNEADLFIHKLNIFHRSIWVWMEFSQVLFDMLEVENEGRRPGSYVGRRAMSQWPHRGEHEAEVCVLHNVEQKHKSSMP